MNARRFYIFFLFLISWECAAGQNLHLSYFSESNGLPSSEVRDVVMDSLGLFWIASDAGLLRFDGSDFTSYAQQIPSQYTRSFCAVAEGLLVSHDAGVSLIRPGLDTTLISEYIEGSINPEDQALYYPGRLFLRQNGDLWISQPGGRLSILTEGSLNEITSPLGNPDQPGIGTFFAETENGILWLAFSNGLLCRYNESTKTIEQALDLPKINELKYRQGELWIAGDNILKLLLSEDGSSIEDNKTYYCRQGEVSTLSLNSQGNIYLGVEEKGLFYLDRRPGHSPKIIKVFSNNNPHSVNELPFRNIYNIVMESDDRLWVCSSDGLGILQRRFFESLGSLPNANTSSICIADNGRIFADFGDVYVIDPADIGYEGSRLPELLGGNVTALSPARKALWTGTSTGRLFRLSQQGRTLASVDLRPRGEGIFYMHFDSRDRLWICQAPEERPLTGIGCLMPDGKLVEYGEESGLFSPVLCLRESKMGRIYCSASGKESYLYRYLPEEDAFLNLSLPLDFNPDVSFAVHDLSVDNNGVVWLASTHGLLRYDMDRVSRIDLGHVNIDTEIRAVCSMDDGSVWVATDTEGIIRFSDKASILIGEESGLPSEVMSYRCLVKEAGGRLWVGSSEGVVFSLDENPGPRNSNIPMLTSARIEDEEISTEAFKIFNDQDLVLEVMAPSYHGYKTFFQYRINEGSWTDLQDSRSILFQEKEAGSYTLEVRSRKEGAYLWSESLGIDVAVHAYWYKNPVFLSIILVLLLILLVLSLTGRRRKYKQNISRLTEGLEMEKQEIEKRTADLEKARDTVLMEQRHIRAQMVSMEILQRLMSTVSPGMKWDLVMEIISIDLLKFPGVVAFEIGSKKGNHIEFEGYSEKAKSFTTARVEFKPGENLSSYTVDLAKPTIYHNLKKDSENLSLQPEKRLDFFKSAISVPFYLEKNPAVLTLYSDKPSHFTKYGLQAMGVFAMYLEQII